MVRLRAVAEGDEVGKTRSYFRFLAGIRKVEVRLEMSIVVGEVEGPMSAQLEGRVVVVEMMEVEVLADGRI